MAAIRLLLATASCAVLAGVSLYAAAQNSAPLGPVSPAHAVMRTAQPGATSRSNRIIVRFKDGVEAGKNTAMQAASLQDRVRALNTFAVSGKAGMATLAYLKSVSGNTHVAQTSEPMDPAALQALAQTLTQDPRVDYAEVDERVFAHFMPNDTFYAAQQGNLQSPFVQAGGANLPNAWGRKLGGVPVSGAGVTVAVLDTGYRPHADLVANIAGGYDFVSQDGFSDFTTANDGNGRDADAQDPGDWNTQASLCDVSNSSWHGTHAAGVIGAVGNNNTGVIGIAYRAKILPVRVLGVCGGYTSDTAAALQWAAGLAVPGIPTNPNPAKIFNMSFGRSGACSQTYQNAIQAAIGAGAVVVASTGNDASTTAISQPSNCQGVIAVTAHTSQGANTDYANVGVGTTISAPGNNVYSLSNAGTTTPGADSYIARSGTSFSAPQVAGVAALLAQIKPGISPAEVKTLLTSSARPYAAGSYCVGRPECGAGLLDAFKAVYALLQSQGVANAAPLMVALPPQYVLPGGALQFTASATDAEGDEAAFIGTGIPSGASFNAVTGVFSWTKAQPAGDYTVVIQPTDGATLGASLSVKISVTTAIPPPPVTPEVPSVPDTPPPPITLVPVANSGGGGGALGWVDGAAALLLLVGTAWARRAAPPKTAY